MGVRRSDLNRQAACKPAFYTYYSNYTYDTSCAMLVVMEVTKMPGSAGGAQKVTSGEINRVLEQFGLSQEQQPRTTEITKVLLNCGNELPEGALPVMIEVLKAFEQGKKVKLVEVEEVLTTTQAAAELDVSRPFLTTNLLGEGAIPFHMVGTHKRILRSDLEAYKAERERRGKILTELIQDAQDLGLGYDD